MSKLNRTQVDNFVLRSAIHESNAGACYQARNQESNTEAVVTILRNVSPQTSAEVREQIAALASVSHDAVYKPANVGDLSDEQMYVATGHFGTHLLARKTKDEAFKDPVVVLELIRQVASGASAAASAGVIHENLSPDHIWLRLRGVEDPSFVPLVVNWGVPFLGDNQLKPAYVYAAPESKVGEPVDVSGAVYPLGILAYEMLAGGHPSEFGWQAAGVTNLRPMPPNLNELRTDLKPETYTLVQTAIRTQAWARYGTFSEFLTAIDAALEAERTRSRGGLLAATAAVGAAPRRNLIAGIAAVAVLAVVVLWLLFGWLPNRNTTVADDATPTAAAVASASAVTGVTLSADTLTADSPLAITWDWPDSDPDAEFVVLLIDAQGEAQTLGTVPATGDETYRLDADLASLPSDRVAPGTYSLVVQLQSAAGGDPLVTTDGAPLRITALTPGTEEAGSSGPASTPTPEPSVAETPTESAETEATPTEADEPTPTLAPTATPTMEPTPTELPTEPPVPAVRVATIAANIRSGPGLAYDILGGLRQGAEVEVIASDDLGFWYLIRLVDGRTGWIAASVTEPAFAGALDGIPVAEFVPPLPTSPPTQPPSLPTATPTTTGTQNTPTPTPTPDQPTATPVQPTPTPIQPTPTPISPTG